MRIFEITKPNYKMNNMTAKRRKRKLGWDKEIKASQISDDLVSKFKKDIETNHIKSEDLGNHSFWRYVETPKGKSTVSVKNVYPISTLPAVEVFWLIAADRGAGREAMQLICDLADKHGVYLELDAIPLKTDQQGKEFKLTREQLVKFYQSFGFKIKEYRDKHPRMIRKPIKTKPVNLPQE
jgi:hypothetical protein